MKSNRLEELTQNYEALINRKNEICSNSNGIYKRYYYPVLTAEHAPLIWKYDFDEKQNPFMEERIGINAVMNTGAIKINHKYYLVARVEGADRKSFFAVAESNSPVDGFRFWDYPIEMPETDIPDTNMYDMRLTAHEDGWIYGIFCAERKDANAPAGDLSSAVAVAGIARTKDLKTWQRLPDLKSPSQQRNVVLHPEFVNGKYALYTRPQDGFIDAGNGEGIGWALIDDICHAEIKEEKIINKRFYHTIKEVKNGEGPHPIKTPQGWLHLAHGVRGCAAGLRYVLYLYMTSLEDPTQIIAEPAGYFMAPIGEERIGDVSNVLFSNGWIEDDNGKVYIYFSQEQIAEMMGCGLKKVGSLLAELDSRKGIGLITRIRQGLGKPDRIYVRRCICVDLSEGNIQTCQNDISGYIKMADTDMSKVPGNDTDKNKTEINDTEYLSFLSADESEESRRKQIEREAYYKIICHNIGYEYLIEECDREMLNEIVALVVDVISSDREFIWIGRDRKPFDVVKSQFLKLNAEHIRFVMKCLRENTSKVVNIRQYLLTVLYNAPLTISNYYSALVQHDMYGNED